MAQDETAQDETADRDRDAPGKRMRGSTAPPRENALIEGEVIKTDAAASETLAGGQPLGVPADASANMEPEPSAAPDETQAAELAAETADTPPETVVPLTEPAPRRASFWPLAAAIVIGAAIAVGGAFGLHRLDQPPKVSGALAQRVAALEQVQTTHQAAPAPAAPDMSALGKRVAGLETDAQAGKADLAHMQQNVQQLGTQLKQAQQDLAARAAKPAPAPVDLAPLSGRIDRLEKQVASFDQNLTALAANRDAEIAKLGSEIGSVRAEKNTAAQAAVAQAEASARAILAASLRGQVEAGEGFADDLSALATHGADAAKLAALRPFAESGVATPAALATQFSALAPTLVTPKPAPKGEGFLARIASDAKHLVRIRKIGDTTGNDPAARVARISAALSSGKLKDALREWNELPAAAKAKSQAFGAALQHRIAAADAAQSIEADALAGLVKVKS